MSKALEVCHSLHGQTNVSTCIFRLYRVFIKNCCSSENHGVSNGQFFCKSSIVSFMLLGENKSCYCSNMEFKTRIKKCLSISMFSGLSRILLTAKMEVRIFSLQWPVSSIDLTANALGRIFQVPTFGSFCGLNTEVYELWIKVCHFGLSGFRGREKTW